MPRKDQSLHVFVIISISQILVVRSLKIVKSSYFESDIEFHLYKTPRTIWRRTGENIHIAATSSMLRI